jgi:hypothetical protein
LQVSIQQSFVVASAAIRNLPATHGRLFCLFTPEPMPIR